MVEGYILDVGCGNMAAIKFPNGKKILIDCNLTAENQEKIVSFLRSKGFDKFDVFINTHRDLDHLRGIEFINTRIPILEIDDNGFSGETDANDYQEYMKLRREKKSNIIKPQTYNSKFCPDVTIRYMNGVYDDVDYDINDTSVVIKIEYKESSILFAGDTSFKPWKEKILPYYGKESKRIKSSLLVASHHGSKTFFDDPADEKNWYTAHLKAISPDMTFISVGKNQWDLPDDSAVELYEKYSKGSNKGNKVFITENKGLIKFELKDTGTWSVTPNGK